MALRLNSVSRTPISSNTSSDSIHSFVFTSMLDINDHILALMDKLQHHKRRIERLFDEMLHFKQMCELKERTKRLLLHQNEKLQLSLRDTQDDLTMERNMLKTCRALTSLQEEYIKTLQNAIIHIRSRLELKNIILKFHLAKVLDKNTILTQTLEDYKCIICKDRYRVVLLLPCAHMKCCKQCVDRLLERSQTNTISCPYCRSKTELENIVHIFI